MPVKATIFSAASKIKPVDDPCKLSRYRPLKPHPGLHSFPCTVYTREDLFVDYWVD